MNDEKNVQVECIKIMKHDYKNHLLSIFYLLEENNVDEAKLYVHSLVKNPIFKKNINKNNAVLNAILNNKIAINPDIHFNINLDIEKFELLSSDLTILLCNAIDNAVEAITNNTHNKIIYIHHKETDQALMIEVQNYYNTEIIRLNNVLQTTKLESSLHGFGIISIEKTVNKYGGNLHIDINEVEKSFNLKVILYKSAIQSFKSTL